MARTPSTSTNDRPGRANRAPGFLRRCVWTIRAVRALLIEAGHVRALRQRLQDEVDRIPKRFSDLSREEYRQLQGTNEWTMMQLREIAERLDHRVTPSQVIRAAVDAAAIGELDLSRCRSEAELKAQLMTRLLIYSQRERDQAVTHGGEG